MINSPNSCGFFKTRDYEEIAHMGQTGDFFIEMANVLNKSHTIQFDFLPGHEHYWDKVLVDNTMDLMGPRGWWVIAFFAALYVFFAFLMANNVFRIERKARDQ